MKKKLVLMGIAAVLTMTAIIGGTLAGFNTQSQQGKTDITTKELGIALVDVAGKAAGAASVTDTYLPGEKVEIPYYVTNNVEAGYELYTRVTIYKYWENTQLQADMIQLFAVDAAGNAVELEATTETGEAVKINDWFVQYADEEQIILYYAKPLAAGQSTGDVLDYLVVNEKTDNSYADQKVIVEIKADAVQKIAADASIPSEWGVYPGFDENGNIVAIAE